MCLQPNNKKPTTDIHYKVFGIKNNELYWAIRNAKGKYAEGKERLPQTIPESTEQGYHVWENKKDAEQFKKLCTKTWSKHHNMPFTTKKVQCTNHIQSGLCIKSGNIFNDNNKKGQAFTYKNIQVIQ